MEKRIKWVDYFKALNIILVVIGHATPLFNNYIYQFHVGAFFMISGYVSNMHKYSMGEFFKKRFHSLIIPYITFATVGTLGCWLLQKNCLLTIFSSRSEVMPLTQGIKSMFSNLQCDWFGAMWFLLVLFCAEIIQKMIITANSNKAGMLYVIVSCYMYIYAYSCLGSRQYPFKNEVFGKALLAQFFYMLGFEIKTIVVKYKISNKMKWYWCAITFWASVLGLVYFGRNRMISMDVASNYVNEPIIDAILVINGFVFVYSISRILGIININKKIDEILSRIGGETMSILIFQFIGFKLVTLILVILGRGPITVLSSLLPPEMFDSLWIFYVLGGIIFPMGIWHGLARIKPLRFCLGLR